ncbi:MAG: protein kinase [Synergistaceae bacterium]|nr:protein kinase [Synergistaceae bacterium]
MNAFRGNTNIVSLEDHKVIEKQGEIGWDIIIRMELLETLSSYITKKAMTQAEIIKLGIHICQALELCAKHNTIHRDIKPDNIFVSQYGDYKLGDFGIARQIERTMSGLSKKGTYQYMAPEVFRGGEYGASVDTYSLGIVMYRFLNKNRAPFLPDYPNPITPRDRDDALQRRMSGEALPHLQNINEELNAIVLKACSYNRAERFQTASDMKAALEALPKDDKALSLPIVEISQQDDASDETEDSTTSATGFNDETEEQTQIIFSKRNTPADEDFEPTEPQIKQSEIFAKKAAVFSSIFFGLLALLTFFSSEQNDMFTFLPLYALCLVQCWLKFKNKAANRLFVCCLVGYLVFGACVDFRVFDFSFLILTLSLVSLMSSNDRKLSLINCAVMIAAALLFIAMIYSGYIHAGETAVPILILLASPAAVFLHSAKFRKLGAGLLLAMQFFIFIVLVLYIVSRSETFFNIINANFPGLSYERFPWWQRWRFWGIAAQFLAFASLFLTASATIKAEFFD